MIIPGSGPTDRDGNSVLGIKASTYALLSQALAERGIASVRIDKRGQFASLAAGDANAVTISDYVADTGKWLAAIQDKTGAQCVWLVGHSEGGLIALAAAQQKMPICGLILLAAPGRKLSDVMREQLRANPANAPILDDALRCVAELEAGRRVDVSKMHPALQNIFNPAVQGFISSLYSYDPAALIKAYAGPVLIVQGSTDMQVAVADADALATAQPRAEKKLLAGVNHVLKHAPADRPGNFATYADPHLPLAPEVGSAVADFILQHAVK